jgi:pyruvate, orthophosphate dikinase
LLGEFENFSGFPLLVNTSLNGQTVREAGKKFVFVCLEGDPDYFDAMAGSEGVITLRGGMTSHAAVVCRGMQKPCVTGVAEIAIDHQNGVLRGSLGEVKE